MQVPSLEELEEAVKAEGKTSYSLPSELTSYSLDEQRQFRPDRSQLGQIRSLTDLRRDLLGADLFAGFETFRSRPEGPQRPQEYLDNLLEALQHCPHPYNQPDFITWRGVLTQILTTPALPHQPWTLRAIRHKGTIYLDDVKEANAPTMTVKSRKLVYGGFNFEHLCHGFSGPVENFSEFGVVMRSRLGPHRLILGAEVDGIDESGAYVELKTCAEGCESQAWFREERLPRYWAQLYLVGIRKIILGLRSPRGRLVDIKILSVPEGITAILGKSRWRPASLLKFGHLCLDWIGREIGEGKIFLIRYTPETRVISAEETESFPDFVINKV